MNMSDKTYNLAFSAQEIDEKLRMVDDLVNANKVTTHHEEIVFNHSESITPLIQNFNKAGRVCIICLQINVTAEITDSYGFTLATLPFAPTCRVWINNDSQFYMDSNSREVRVNNDRLSTGNYMLSGFYLTNE